MTVSRDSRTRTLVMLFAFVLTMTALAAFAPTAAADPGDDHLAPVWVEGDGLGLTFSIDPLELFETSEDEIKEALELLLNMNEDGMVEIEDLSIRTMELNGAISMQVAQVTADDYILVQKMAFGLSIDATLKVLLDISDAGIQGQKVTLSLNLSSGLAEELTLVFDNDTMELSRLSVSMQPRLDLAVSGSGIPDSSDDGSMKFSTIDIKVKANPGIRANATFEPALNLFNLPNPDAASWSMMTEDIHLNASIFGGINMQASGTHSYVKMINEELEEIFFEPPAGIIGLDGFPIDLSSLTVPESFLGNMGIEIVDGALSNITFPIPETDLTGMGDYVHGGRTIYVIWVDDPLALSLAELLDMYDFPSLAGILPLPPGEDYPEGILYSTCLLDINDWGDYLEGMADNLIPDDLFGLDLTSAIDYESVTPAEANAVINTITQNLGAIGTGDFPVEVVPGLHDYASFFLDPPYLGVLALVGMLVLVGLVTRR